MDTNQFEALLQEQSTDFIAAEEVGQKWYPSQEGQYVCIISSLQRRIYKKKNSSYLLWNFGLQLLEGEEAGNVMPYVISSEGEMGLGRVKATASTLQGSKFTGDLSVANLLFSQALESKTPLLCKYERKARTDGQEGYWENVYINKKLAQVVQPTPETSEEAVS